eukprot:4260639-Amphidinium_carterae.1
MSLRAQALARIQQLQPPAKHSTLSDFEDLQKNLCLIMWGEQDKRRYILRNHRAHSDKSHNSKMPA